MPIYEFRCQQCSGDFDTLTSYDASGEYEGVICPECGSPEKTRLLSAAIAVFPNPRGTSKADSFSYVAGFNMEQAKSERRNAEAKSHMGATPFNAIDDISSGKHEGPVK